MVFLGLLLFTLSVCKLPAVLGVFTCPKGELVTNGGGCAPCPEGYYQPHENPSKQCKRCTKCAEDLGSMVSRACTKVSNTECLCRENFYSIEDDSSTCKCGAGFGLSQGGCSKCKPGFFSQHPNSRCNRWKECKSGVKVPGNSTADNVCNPDLNGDVRLPPTTHRPLSTLPGPDHPQGGVRTQGITAADPRPATPPPPPPPQPGTSNATVIILLAVGMVGLVIAVAGRVHGASFWRRDPEVQNQDSLCRQPVEESGDDSLLSLKINPDRP